jgi:ATP-dependent exoDNAse (exonuclease V) beta subunit
MWNTKQQNAIEYGNTIHEILSFIKTKEDVDLAITKAIENGLIVTTQKAEVTKTISEIVTHPELVDFFADEVQVLNEKTIIQKGGNLAKPDRMVLTKSNEIYLLDYKTGSHLPNHQVQLENYQKAIEEMGYKVVKKTLIYIGENCNIVNL